MTVDQKKLVAGLPAEDVERVFHVSEFSQNHLKHIHRRSGETYADHCNEVAATLKESDPSTSLLCTALLHDVLVHPDGKELLLESPLLDSEKELVQHMHALRRLHISEKTEDLDTVMDAFLGQPELLPLRMAHRVNDVRNMARFSKQLQQQIAQESLHMYAAIAGRLGMQRWRVIIEDGSFPVLQPKIASALQDQFAATADADTACLHHTKDYLVSALQEHGIEAQVQIRIKGLYSTYRKMVIKSRSFEDLTDRLALRILVANDDDCYRALGVIHSVMRPIPGKLKDYIGAPKENGYRSIHTVVYPLPGVTEQPMELQIRTAQMHRDCEYGPAAHADYKRTVYALERKTARVNLFRNLKQLREETKTPRQFEEALRMFFREDQIAIFDPDNNVYHITSPASAMDFVCHVYPQKFTRVKEVRINGRKQALATPLHDGDTVEARFSREGQSQRSWIEACLQKATEEKIREEISRSGTTV